MLQDVSRETIYECDAYHIHFFILKLVTHDDKWYIMF